MSEIQTRKEFICDNCGKVFSKKCNLYKHLKNIHKKKDVKYNLEVPKGENPTVNESITQNDKSPSFPAPKKFKCNVCECSYTQNFQLKYHIRRKHYNLQAKLPYCERKKVNQVWFEKVLNSKNIVEIKKTEPNMLLMRKLDEKTSIKVNDNVTEIIDLKPLYPTGTPKTPKINLKRCKSVNLVEFSNYNLVTPL